MSTPFFNHTKRKRTMKQILVLLVLLGMPAGETDAQTTDAVPQACEPLLT
jgi:hypothetical protein